MRRVTRQKMRILRILIGRMIEMSQDCDCVHNFQELYVDTVQELDVTTIKDRNCEHRLDPACVHNHNVSTDIVYKGILSLFHILQPSEQKRMLDLLTDVLNKSGFTCTYCGGKVRGKRVVWLGNLPICRRCHSWLFSPKTKMRLVYGVRRDGV
jgi:hypothetical protein